MLIALVLLTCLQANDIDRLLVEIESEDLDVRERASAALAAMDDAAEAALRRRLASLEGEAKARVAAVLACIAKAREHARYLPALRRVTIDCRDQPLEDMLADLKRQCGWDVRAAGTRKSLTVRASDATPFEALDAVASAAGLGIAIDKDGSVVLRCLESRAPRVHVRHYRVVAVSVEECRTSDFKEDHAFALLDLALEWPPEVRPDAVPRFEVTSIVDDTGRVLPRAKAGVLKWSVWYEPRPGRAMISVPFVHPAASASRLASVKGRAKLRFPSCVRTMRFAPLGTSVGSEQEHAGLRVRLSGLKSDEEHTELSLRFTGRYARSCDPDDEMSTASANALYIPAEALKPRFFAQDGTRLQYSDFRRDGAKSWETWRVTFSGAAAPPASIELDVASDSFYDVVEFELKDVPLPKKPND